LRRPGLHLAATNRREPDVHSLDCTQGQQIGSNPYDDATQGRRLGSRPHDDATRPFGDSVNEDLLDFNLERTSRPPGVASDPRVTASEWFASGARRPYDPIAKTMLESADGEGSQPLQVFERIVARTPVSADARWLTMLPGYPDGSYGYAQVDRRLGAEPAPCLYIEYLGQGDSDKPARYRYSSIERADLIQAQWRAHGVRNTMVVAFDYSSLALLELLRRQQERDAAGEHSGTRIDAAFIVNGGLFPDCHSHPWNTTPMLKTQVGRVAMWLGQQVPGVLEATLRNGKLFSPSYRVSVLELADLIDAIRRRGGAAFMHRAAGFVEEHRRNATRWDFAAIARELQDNVAFHIAGSKEDPFEPRQITAARRRLGPLGVDIQSFPGGHLTTFEHPELLAAAIREIARAHRVG
jgi:pimeloyl-ACP methyl ester carboxylesterase